MTRDAQVRRYGVELDAERSRIASSKGIKTVQGNTFDTIAKPESFSLLYLNPPYDSEIGTIANRRMEAVFLEHTYRWLRIDGILILVIPFERLHECSGTLSSHFASLRVFRMTDPDSVQYRQIAVFGVRRDVRGLAVDNSKRQLHSISLYKSFLELAELQPGVCAPYSVPPSGEATLNYRGLPYDLLEDLLPYSGAWRQAATLLTPHDDIATGRPITPLHGGHGENAALTTPVTVTGTAEELDRDLPATLVNFVSSHLELKNTLDRAKSEMDDRGENGSGRSPGEIEDDSHESCSESGTGKGC